MKIIFIILLSFFTTPLFAQDAFTTLDNFSVQLLEDVIKRDSQKLSPVIISYPSVFIALYHNGKIDRKDALPPKADWLKDIDHLSIALVALFYPFNERHIDEEKLQKLNEIIAASKKNLPASGFSPQQKERQQKFFDLSRNIIEKTLKQGKLSPIYYQRFFAEIRPLVNANTKDSLFYEMNQTCNQVRIWREQMSKKEWQQLTVLIIGNQVVHSKSVIEDYFKKLLNTKPDYLGRLIIMDNINTIEESLKYLANIRISAIVGQVVLADSMGVLQDVYSPFWNDYLEKTRITTEGCFAK